MAQGFRLGGTLLRPRRAGVGTDYRTVNQQMLQVRFPRDMGLQLGPDAAFRHGLDFIRSIVLNWADRWVDFLGLLKLLSCT
ncbi:MAG: hypothetical protein WAW42_20765 [Candidatus Competibacteraceae bacterium]|jgi:hypothetical protein